MKREYRCNADVELRKTDAAELPTIRGYAAVFNKLSEPIMGFRERVLPGAFRKSLASADVRALIDHNPAQVIGRSKSKTLSLKEDDKGLYVEIEPPNTTMGRDLVESIRRGDLDQMSFGFRTIEDNWKTEDGKQVRELIEVDLFDVSVVAFPAYSQTSVAVRSLFPDGVPENIQANAQPSPVTPLETNSAARKRVEELTKEFGIKH